ncbi:MAG: DHH family phosphoesterase [Bacilli bacterium]|nr:DHH family phosphoesterase [Bacilli bacterium]
MIIDADKIRDLINESSNIVIMAHKNLDLDALGSSLGVYYLAKKLDKKVFLLIEDNIYEAGVERALKELKKEKVGINIKTLIELEKEIDNKTLLFILDVSVLKLTQNEEAVKKIKNTILIDHHVMDKKSINKVTYEYVLEDISSTTEIIIELIKDLNIYIHPYVATIMLSGIVIDTKGFFKNTTYTTYKAAAFLSKQGADDKELQYLLKEDLTRYKIRQKIIDKVKIIKKHTAVGTGDSDIIYYNEDLAKVSETLLLFNDIEVSYTIGKISNNTVGISARSLGKINVEEIMNQLGGGGHVTDAATQLKNISIEEAKDKLMKIIYNI